MTERKTQLMIIRDMGVSGSRHLKTAHSIAIRQFTRKLWESSVTDDKIADIALGNHNSVCPFDNAVEVLQQSTGEFKVARDFLEELHSLFPRGHCFCMDGRRRVVLDDHAAQRRDHSYEIYCGKVADSVIGR